jgi:hypothetical protein
MHTVQENAVNIAHPLFGSSSRLLLGLVASVALIAGVGCAQPQANVPMAPMGGVDGDPAAVEVFEEREPDHAFVEAGDLWARSMSKPGTIERLRKEAAKFYMDGIYAVECTGPLYGECTAKGFVYRGGRPVEASAQAAGVRGQFAAR